MIWDVGCAWGRHVEEFQEKGRPPERARVRRTKVLMKGAHGWQVLLYHRDIQFFGDDGRYPRSLTIVSPAPAATERRQDDICRRPGDECASEIAV